MHPLSEINDFAHIPGDSPVYGLMVVGLPPSAESRQNFRVAGVTQLTLSKTAFRQTRTRLDGDDPKSESASECDEVEEHFATYVARVLQ